MDMLDSNEIRVKTSLIELDKNATFYSEKNPGNNAPYCYRCTATNFSSSKPSKVNYISSHFWKGREKLMSDDNK